MIQKKNYCIFQEEWWLNSVAPNRWKYVEVQKSGEIIARMPYVIKKKYGMTMLGMPALTQALGPWLNNPDVKYAKKLAIQKVLMNQLIQQLPKFDYFLQNFHYNINNWLPFYWNKFDATTRYTYILENLSDLNSTWNGIQSNIRTDIKKAQNKYKLNVHSEYGIEKFLDINTLTFKRQGMNLPYEKNTVLNIEEACKQRDRRKILFAEDQKGNIHGAIYIIWDENSAYYLMGGSDPLHRNSGAMSLLVWEAIKHVSSLSIKFDFEGSMIEPIERFFRAFGAKQVPYFQVSKIGSRRMGIYQGTKAIIKSISRG